MGLFSKMNLGNPGELRYSFIRRMVCFGSKRSWVRIPPRRPAITIRFNSANLTFHWSQFKSKLYSILLNLPRGRKKVFGEKVGKRKAIDSSGLVVNFQALDPNFRPITSSSQTNLQNTSPRGGAIEGYRGNGTDA
jgi:hypothetical protein